MSRIGTGWLINKKLNIDLCRILSPKLISTKKLYPVEFWFIMPCCIRCFPFNFGNAVQREVPFCSDNTIRHCFVIIIHVLAILFLEDFASTIPKQTVSSVSIVN